MSSGDVTVVAYRSRLIDCPVSQSTPFTRSLIRMWFYIYGLVMAACGLCYVLLLLLLICYCGTSPLCRAIAEFNG